MIEIVYNVRSDKWVLMINNVPIKTYNTELEAIRNLIIKDNQCIM